MPKLKIMFGDINSQIDVEEIIYKSKKAKLSLRDEKYSEEVLKWNPHLEGKPCTYIVVNLNKLTDIEFNELSSHIRVFNRRETGVDSLIIKKEEKEILITTHSIYHSLFNELQRMNVMSYYYKTYSLNPRIPNNGSPLYVNPPLHRIPYNLYQLTKLYTKRKILCQNHNFIDKNEYRSYCTKCGAKQYSDTKKIDWFFE